MFILDYLGLNPLTLARPNKHWASWKFRQISAKFWGNKILKRCLSLQSTPTQWEISQLIIMTRSIEC